MKITKYPAPPIESAASRYDRDWLNIPNLDTEGKDDHRRDRTLLRQTQERKSRRYVDNGISAVTGTAPIYGEDGSIIEPPIDPESLWTENFTGPLGSEWSLEGTYNPPGGQPTGNDGETLFQISRPFASKKFKIDIELNLPNQANMEDGYFLPQMVLQSPANDSMVGMFAQLDTETNKMSITAYIGTEHGPIEFTGNMISFTGDGRDFIVSANGDELFRQADTVDLGNDTVLMVVLQTNIGGSIKSVAAYNLDDNGGGTPEPEEPETPDEPDIPAGSYQKAYTNRY